MYCNFDQQPLFSALPNYTHSFTSRHTNTESFKASFIFWAHCANRSYQWAASDTCCYLLQFTSSLLKLSSQNHCTQMTDSETTRHNKQGAGAKKLTSARKTIVLGSKNLASSKRHNTVKNKWSTSASLSLLMKRRVCKVHDFTAKSLLSTSKPRHLKF